MITFKCFCKGKKIEKERELEVKKIMLDNYYVLWIFLLKFHFFYRLIAFRIL